MNSEVLDPELKAHITNLVSALGGPDLDDPERKYKLGDDALGCLRDLKRWLKSYDDQHEKLDVARAISETSLVTFDLLEILTSWETACEQGRSNPQMDRIALACLELIVPLTWPLELNKMTANANQYLHKPALDQARVRYKQAILTHPKQKVLKAAIRLAIPGIKISLRDRTSRDEGILKLVVYFFRNLLAIEIIDSILDADNDISTSSTLLGYQKQNVLDFLVTIAAGIGTTFEIQDTIILECLFHMLKGISAKEVMADTESVNAVRHCDGPPKKRPDQTKGPDDLSGLLKKEKEMESSFNRHAASRHNRFGTMVSMVINDDTRLALSGQKGLASMSESLEQLDAKKKWHKPLRRKVDEGQNWNNMITLSKTANVILNRFINKFIDAAFNPLFLAIRKLIEKDSERLLQQHKMHYLFLNAWFLEAERVRSVEATDYGLVGSALSQNSFIILMKAMRESSERGELHSVDTVFTSMMFFKQILLAVNDMDYKGSEEAKEISENMKSRLFYEASSLDVLIHLPRNANKYSNAYLKECIELCHITLKTLEAYSKQHTTLFVKSKRQKMRKKRKNGEPITDDQDYGESEDEEKESARITLERKFEFAKFESRFINENTIDSYVKFLSNFRELTAREIKWVISFFHRCFVKREARTVFFRLDIMRLLQMMTSSSKGLIHKNESRHDVERFTIYYVNKLTTALERTPSLFAELLFNKMPESIFYFDNGYDKVKEQKDRKNEWDFRDADIDEERKYAIIVAALLDEDKNNMAEWAVIKIGEIREKRARWIEMNTAMHIENSSDEPPPEIPDEVVLVEGGDREFLKDGKFELLLKLIGFKIDRSKQSMVLSSSISQSRLDLAEKYIKRYLFESVDFGEMVAVDLLKKKNQIEYRTESESETDMRGEMDDFVTNDADDQDRDKNSLNSSGFNDSRFDALPDDERLAKKLSIMKRLHPLEKKKSKKGPKRAKVNESEKDARKTQRALEEAQKRKRIKSSAFVSDSDTDEERDKEFFERERLLRERMANNSFVNSQVSIEGKHSQRVPTLSPEPSSTAVGDSSDAVFDTIHGSEGSVVESNEELSLFVTDEEIDVATTQIRQRKRNIVLSDDENEDEN